GDGGSVAGHHRPPAPRRLGVNGPCHELLATTAGGENENVKRLSSNRHDLRSELPHERAFTDQTESVRLTKMVRSAESRMERCRAKAPLDAKEQKLVLEGDDVARRNLGPSDGSAFVQRRARTDVFHENAASGPRKLPLGSRDPWAGKRFGGDELSR